MDEKGEKGGRVKERRKVWRRKGQGREVGLEGGKRETSASLLAVVMVVLF